MGLTTKLPDESETFEFQCYHLYHTVVSLNTSQYRRFRNTTAFLPVPRSAVLRGLTVFRYSYYSIIGYAFVEYTTEEEARTAMGTLHKTEQFGSQIRSV